MAGGGRRVVREGSRQLSRAPEFKTHSPRREKGQGFLLLSIYFSAKMGLKVRELPAPSKPEGRRPEHPPRHLLLHLSQFWKSNPMV